MCADYGDCGDDRAGREKAGGAGEGAQWGPKLQQRLCSATRAGSGRVDAPSPVRPYSNQPHCCTSGIRSCSAPPGEELQAFPAARSSMRYEERTRDRLDMLTGRFVINAGGLVAWRRGAGLPESMPPAGRAGGGSFAGGRFAGSGIAGGDHRPPQPRLRSLRTPRLSRPRARPLSVASEGVALHPRAASHCIHELQPVHSLCACHHTRTSSSTTTATSSSTSSAQARIDVQPIPRASLLPRCP